MERRIALIGFGEAAMAFAQALGEHAALRAFDRQTDVAATAAAKRADYARCAVSGCDRPEAALENTVAALSLVTADQALAAAEAAAPHIAGRYWCDMNSVAPDTKRAAAHAIEAAGGRYVDVAVMAPVHPARAAVPLLLSGPHAAPAADMLRSIGFRQVRVVPGEVGRASAIKMIRSVMVKGIEALTAECVIAAERAGVLDEVLASLDASPPPPSWAMRADYNLDRMMVHGLRRAAEVEEVVKTLDMLATGAAMTRGTLAWQRAIGGYGLTDPAAGLTAKLAALKDAA